jgi:P27 family predicted phage terminase small subunit
LEGKLKKLKPPDHLSIEAKALWKAICRDYSIDEAAGMVLKVTLEAYDRRTQARDALIKHGVFFKDRFGQLKPMPMVAVERDAAATVMRGFRTLGLDLAAPGMAGVYSGGREK